MFSTHSAPALGVRGHWKRGHWKRGHWKRWHWKRWHWKWELTLALLASGCGAAATSQHPQRILSAYAQALEQGKVEAAYGLLSQEAQKSIPLDAFRRMVIENRDEVKNISNSLLRPSSSAQVTATVTTRDGHTLLLVLEDGQWKVDGAALDLYGQRTPEGTVQSFVRAFENKRYDVLLRFVPASETEGLNKAKLRQAWEGDQKAEMQRLVQALKAALPTARFERIGHRATMTYGSGGTVELVHEAGAWKIEDLR
ncbi:hypothetical protein ACFL5O_00805 [Myxococcota bacterium]